MNMESMSAAQVLEKVIEARNDMDLDTEGRVQLSQDVKNWVIDRTSSDEWIAYLPSLTLTVLMAPFASELYTYAWQELASDLSTVEGDL